MLKRIFTNCKTALFRKRLANLVVGCTSKLMTNNRILRIFAELVECIEVTYKYARNIKFCFVSATLFYFDTSISKKSTDHIFGDPWNDFTIDFHNPILCYLAFRLPPR